MLCSSLIRLLFVFKLNFINLLDDAIPALVEELKRILAGLTVEERRQGVGGADRAEVDEGSIVVVEGEVVDHELDEARDGDEENLGQCGVE